MKATMIAIQPRNTTTAIICDHGRQCSAAIIPAPMMSTQGAATFT
jgi:hypothetical protein